VSGIASTGSFANLDGLIFRHDRFQDSDVHSVEVDLARCRIAAVPTTQAFPMIYTGCPRPPQLAKDAGALCSVGGDFNMTVYAGTGVWNEPLHPLAIGSEVWTTGVGPGFSYFGGDGIAWVRPGNTFNTIWHDGKPLKVDHVNRGHEGTVILTPRGGANERPRSGRWYTPLVEASSVVDPVTVVTGGTRLVRYLAAPSTQVPVPVMPRSIVVESDQALDLFEIASVTTWQTHFPVAATEMISGMTPLVRDGANVVSDVYGGPDPGGPDAPYRERNPRTGLGVSRDGRTAYVVVVAGRIATSRGLTLKGFAHEMQRLGCWNATNLDGGGSTHLWARHVGLVVDSCYGDGTLEGIRPNVYATAVFAR
jgi:hypothetical protein